MKFFDWALKQGQQMAVELDYVPLPEPVVALTGQAWKTEVKDASGRAVWTVP